MSFIILQIFYVFLVISAFAVEQKCQNSSIDSFEVNEAISWSNKKHLLFNWFDKQIKIGNEINSKFKKSEFTFEVI